MNYNRIKKIVFFLAGAAMLAGCSQSTKESGASTENDSTAMEIAATDFSLYAQVDSAFKIKDKIFQVLVKQYDLTEDVAAKGDTLSRPTYACTVKIVDANNKKIFADSVLRDTWGYPGKIVSIDVYQIALPQLRYEGNEIIMAFSVFEQVDGDAIQGLIACNVNTGEARYYWQEATGE